jgi:hypothetical protein
VGTEFGLSFSADSGAHWVRFHGMPPVPIRDLEIQKRESDLAAASFGRGFFIVDDYSALREITPEVLQSEGTLFAPGRKARLYDELRYYRAGGDDIGSPNPPFGAILSYYLRYDVDAGVGEEAPRVVVEVADGNGRIVRQLDASSRAGLHRVAWDLRESVAPNAPIARGPVGQGGGAPFAELLPGVANQEAQSAGRAPAGRGGGRGGRGSLVKPGTYTITLGKVVGGTFAPLGKPEKLEVVPLEASNR